MRLKIGDDFLDGDNSVIAQTFAVNEVSDIQTQQGGFSNDFTIPLTAKNKSILGFPDNINTSSTNAYEKVEATLFDLGVPIAEGYLRYSIVNDTELEASFFSDNVNWFNLLKGKTLKDLDLSEYDHFWEGASVKAIVDQDVTEGYTYPLIDYNNPFRGEVVGGDKRIEDWSPCMFFSTLVKQLYFDIGWKADGAVLDHPVFKQMILPFSDIAMNHTDQWVTDNTQTGDTATVPFNFTAAASPTWVTAAATTITWTQDSAALVVTLNFRVTGTAPWQVDIVQTSPLTAHTYTKNFLAPGAGGKDYTIVSDVFPNVFNGDTIRVDLTATGGPTNTLVATSTISFAPTNKVVKFSTLQMSELQPAIKQTDFLRYIAFTFGAILQANANSKTVTWSFFRDIKNNLDNALDWSDKLDFSKTREIDFIELLRDYAQTSNIKYASDSNDDFLTAYEDRTGRGFGDGAFNIDNEHIAQEDDFYTAPFAATANVWEKDNQSNYFAFIPWYNGVTNVQGGKIKPRVLLISKNIDIADMSTAVTSYDIINEDTTSSNITAVASAWFAKIDYESTLDGYTDTLAYDSVVETDIDDRFPLVTLNSTNPLKDRFLGDYEDILNSVKYLKASLWLTEVDIANLDFTRPIYLDRYKSYFYISKIENFQGRERTTECELVKIS